MDATTSSAAPAGQAQASVCGEKDVRTERKGYPPDVVAASGSTPADVPSFSALHNHCDANDYLTEADVPWGGDGTDAGLVMLNAVSGEVDRRLRERAARMLTPQRKAQGFRSQAHLDAFYACRDHEAGCGECGQPGQAMWLEGSASWQPTVTVCPEGTRLQRISGSHGSQVQPCL